MPKFAVFPHEGQVWELSNVDTEDEVEQRVPHTDYPVEVWLQAVDHREGDGWGRKKLTKLLGDNGKLLEDFEWDVSGTGSVYQALLVQVKDEATLHALLSSDLQLLEKTPTPL